MDYEFKKNTLDGRYFCSFSMGHEIIGRWLEEEVAQQRGKIEQVFSIIEKSKKFPQQEWKIAGKEISVYLCDGEVSVQENVLSHTIDEVYEEDVSLYDSESSASCGLNDFEALMVQWRDFI